MQKTNIGWVLNDDGSPGESWNPLKGRCPNNCPYCYANSMRNRFKMYDGPLKLDEVELQRPLKRKKPCTIFVCSMNELFGPWVPFEWQKSVFKVADARNARQHRFLFLTKQPRVMNLAISRYSSLVGIVRRHWMGLTLTGNELHSQLEYLRELSDFGFPTFISAEPLIEKTSKTFITVGFRWLIIGSLNKNGRAVPPDKGGTRVEWVWPILERADKLGIPVFLKKELLRLYPELPKRREVPWIKN